MWTFILKYKFTLCCRKAFLARIYALVGVPFPGQKKMVAYKEWQIWGMHISQLLSFSYSLSAALRCIASCFLPTFWGPLRVSTFLLWRLDWVVPIRQRIWRNWPKIYLQSLGQMWTSLFKRRQQHIYWTNLFKCNWGRISAWGKCWWKGRISKLICTRAYPNIPANQCFSQRQVEMQFVAFDVVIFCICMFFPLSYFWMYLHIYFVFVY